MEVACQQSQEKQTRPTEVRKRNERDRILMDQSFLMAPFDGTF